MTGDTRSSALPNVPTFKEAGVPEFDLASWTVMLAPKGTPAEIVDADPQGNARRDRRSRRPARRWPSRASSASPSQDVRAFLVNERDNFGRAVRELGIRMGE